MNTSPVADHISINAVSNNSEAIHSLVEAIATDNQYLKATVTKDRHIFRLVLAASPEPLT